MVKSLKEISVSCLDTVWLSCGPNLFGLTYSQVLGLSSSVVFLLLFLVSYSTVRVVSIRFAVCTGYGSIRHYDKRAGKKASSTVEVLKGEIMLTHVVKSEVDDNLLYAVSQEGVPMLLDRRFNCRTLRRMRGAKGSVRDCKVLVGNDSKEFLMTVGCDRYLRVFDVSIG